MCGGFLPWVGWKEFLQYTNEVGNGGPLQRPSLDFEEINQKIKDGKLILPQLKIRQTRNSSHEKQDDEQSP